MGTYEWAKQGLFDRLNSDKSLLPLNFSTDSSALGNQITSGFKIKQSDGFQKTGDLAGALSGKKVSVFGNGKKLFTSEIVTNNGYSEALGPLSKRELSIEFDKVNSLNENKNFKRLVPSSLRKQLPDEVHTVKDFFQSYGISNIKVRPFQADTGSSTGSTGSENNAMKNSSKIGVGAVAVAVAGYGLYRVIS